MSNKTNVQWLPSTTLEDPAWSIAVPVGHGCPRRSDQPWKPKQDDGPLRHRQIGSVLDEDHARTSDWNYHNARYHHSRKVASAMTSSGYAPDLGSQQLQGRETDGAPAVMRTVAQMWPKPCEAMFDYIAENSPQDMFYAITMTNMSVGMKARAARAAGLIKDSAVAIPLLSLLVHDAQPMVQEGALLGLSRHLANAQARALVQGIADRKDVHEVVREVALDLLSMD